MSYDTYTVIAYGAADKGLRCDNLHTGSNNGFIGVGYCDGVGDGICNDPDVAVIQAEDLANASDDSECLEPRGDSGELYTVRSECVFW